ncbi:hypothetical protein Nepgr_025719 [Nepenthes gracilis]|uniref:DRBM domain-containing protein n=1 Tax=Nepenthes gracilis TaxID=150966 RepID=A0AAD3T774_NEPGR|nr:hypothetical protein Nepgr_025719 [Nepenthes gracilis]
MYKNQLQELAQRSCFNLPSYACMREGPDHAPRFRASVNFNGEIFESPGYSSTLRQAEHSAAEVALNALSTRGSKSLTARVLDETGVYKNLLQETAHKAGLDLPVYTTVRSGPGHVPVFTCTVELAGMDFTGEPAKTKKQAEKNAAIAAWSALKKMPNFVLKKETDNHEEQDKEIVRRVLSNLRPRTENQTVRRTVRRFHKDNRNSSASPVKYQSWRPLDYLLNSASSETQPQQQTSSCSSFVDLLPPPPPRTTSKILPLTFSSFPHKRHRNSPAQIATQSQVTMQEIPNYSKREDEERFDGSMKWAGKECTTTWSNTCKPFTMPSTSTSTTQQEHIKNKIFRPFSSSSTCNGFKSSCF